MGVPKQPSRGDGQEARGRATRRKGTRAARGTARHVQLGSIHCQDEPGRQVKREVCAFKTELADPLEWCA